jgi:hypothetical protein
MALHSIPISCSSQPTSETLNSSGVYAHFVQTAKTNAPLHFVSISLSRYVDHHYDYLKKLIPSLALYLIYCHYKYRMNDDDTHVMMMMMMSAKCIHISHVFQYFALIIQKIVACSLEVVFVCQHERKKYLF